MTAPGFFQSQSDVNDPRRPAARLSFGELLRAYRLDAALSQAELAARLAVHHGLVVRFERDEQRPTRDQLDLLITAMDLSPAMPTRFTDAMTRDPAMMGRLPGRRTASLQFGMCRAAIPTSPGATKSFPRYAAGLQAASPR